ncbi:MAG TPA: hypothetical protein VFA93_01760 [Patescibacteria group bacterium]|nr:hypothetical protein [Patescibacteria group bacterium]
MTSEALRYSKEKAKADRANYETGSIILRGNIEHFLEKSGDRSGMTLLEFDQSEDGLLHNVNGQSVLITKKDLETLITELRKRYELEDKRSKAVRRTEVDPVTYKPIVDSYTEYRNYPTDNRDLVFKRIQVWKDGVVLSTEWSINGVHSGPITKSVLLPPKRQR